MIIQRLLFRNFFLKIISLLLAFLSWLYVNNEVIRAKKEEKVTFIWDKELNLEVRQIPIRANIKGSPPRGYVFVESQLLIKPSHCNVVGRKSVLDKIEFLETEPIEIGKFTKTTSVKTTLTPLPNVVILEGEVELTLPITKKKRW